MKLKELKEELEDLRAWVLKYDDPDDTELATSRRISALIERLEKEGVER